MTLLSGADAQTLLPWGKPIVSTPGFITALLSGGDSRITPDPITGLNQYLCSALPVPGHVYAASCTASPASERGFDAAAQTFARIQRLTSPRHRADRLAALADNVEGRLSHHFDVESLARVFLCPSGTDALLTTTRLLAAERPDEAMTTILPAASETGTGVPMAAAGRIFTGPDHGRSLLRSAAQTIEIPLRSHDGAPYPRDTVNQAFAAAANDAAGRAVVILTHSTKTGLIAPIAPATGADVIVDACQARIAPQTIAAYLRRGWPVVITGSKFYGGPAFSGAILFPTARLPTFPTPLPGAPDLGTLLRWTASLTEIDAFAGVADADLARTLAGQTASIEQGLASNPALVPIEGLQPRGPHWADQPGIFTFAVRDPADHRRNLSLAKLRPIHQRLARTGVLVGQPVGLGPFGGLRIAIGARDLVHRADPAFPRLFAALEHATTPASQPLEASTSCS